jgi:hypothetical protein
VNPIELAFYGVGLFTLTWVAGYLIGRHMVPKLEPLWWLTPDVEEIRLGTFTEEGLVLEGEVL